MLQKFLEIHIFPHESKVTGEKKCKERKKGRKGRGVHRSAGEERGMQSREREEVRGKGAEGKGGMEGRGGEEREGKEGEARQDKTRRGSGEGKGREGFWPS